MWTVVTEDLKEQIRKKKLSASEESVHANGRKEMSCGIGPSHGTL